MPDFRQRGTQVQGSDALALPRRPAGYGDHLVFVLRVLTQHTRAQGAILLAYQGGRLIICDEGLGHPLPELDGLVV